MSAEKPDACQCLQCRHLDSARYYENEAEVAKAVRESGIPREDVFVTTKVWLSDFGYKNAKRVKAASKGLPHVSISPRAIFANFTHLQASMNYEML